MSLANGGGELTIREVSSRTGVSEGTLRMWETRYSFPTPQRLASGHRRYSEQDLDQVRAVVRARSQGLSLRSAIDHARTLSAEPRPSVFSALRETFPDLRPTLLPKPALTAISHAIEDESLARGVRPVLIGCFQHQRFFHQARERWRELARTAEVAVVLAEFARPGRARTGPIEVSLHESDPLCREWVLVCDAPGFSACLSGWERPREPGIERQFETIWSFEPSVVRAAARACYELAERAAPEQVRDLRQRLSAPAPPLGTDVRTVLDLTTRIVLYAARGETTP
jgi:DICT domain-containing protein/predicted DNA-binding transcriptional regulator AlpA